MKWAVAAVAVAIVVAALLVSMAANDGCLPWQEMADAGRTRRGVEPATVCR